MLTDWPICVLVVHRALSMRELLTEHERPRYVISRSRMVAETYPATMRLQLTVDDG